MLGRVPDSVSPVNVPVPDLRLPFFFFLIGDFVGRLAAARVRQCAVAIGLHCSPFGHGHGCLSNSGTDRRLASRPAGSHVANRPANRPPHRHGGAADCSARGSAWHPRLEPAACSRPTTPSYSAGRPALGPRAAPGGARSPAVARRAGLKAGPEARVTARAERAARAPSLATQVPPAAAPRRVACPASAVFCDDFDQGELGAGWDMANLHYAELDTAHAHSPPAAMRVQLPEQALETSALLMKRLDTASESFRVSFCSCSRTD
jgi:hypothetical protein